MKFAVLLRNPRAADARAFQAKFVNQLARRNRRRIFEHAAGARRGGLRTPALLAERLHPLLDFFARLPACIGTPRPARCDFSASRNSGIPRTSPPASVRARSPAKSITRHGLDDIKRRAAHRAGVHAQRAADAAGNAFQKFHAAQAVALRLDRDIFQPRARAAANARCRQFQSGKIPAATGRSPRRENRRRARANSSRGPE